MHRQPGCFPVIDADWLMPTLLRMTEAQYSAYLDEAIPGFAAEKVAAGQWSQEDALALSRKSFQDLLPQGLDTPDNHLYAVQDGHGNPVGMLWFGVQSRAGKRIAFVCDVSTRPEHRRKGFATSAFLALEEEARTMGLSGIALHVFGFNTEAQLLYSKLGFRATNISMFKSVAAPATEPLRYTLIAATPAHHEWLESLRREAYADLFQATWGAWDEARHARHFAECLERGHIYIIVVGHNQVGMIQKFDLPEALEIGEIQIRPQDRNHGLGSRVLLDAIANARRDGKTVRLSVALKNFAALRLYERLGFRAIGRSDTHNNLESGA
jgi:ribosomal protein S18 acetylase RimI-like enzyme